MKKYALLTLAFALSGLLSFAQTGKYWSVNQSVRGSIPTDKAVSRLSFPKEFKLFNLNLAGLRDELFRVADNRERHSTVITLPNVDGQLEDFEVVEASNFEPALQARFPEIRAFSGKGIQDRSATLKISLSPQGIQTMIFRTEKQNEFIEPYSQDHTVYAVFNSFRQPGQLPWTCSTVDQGLANGIHTQVMNTQRVESSAGQLKTMRLAQSCNAEYSNFFGATSSAQESLVLAAFNATLTRCNGVYEKDLALHLNLIANTTSVIYYNATTDPYTTLANWNSQLQSTLTSVIGEANYDIGHMFGASGGGGNAGCIGCVCTNGSKGSGITSPADGIPQGDNFDIDYVVHEVGHQLGGNHTFSHSNEGSGVNKEVGSGITIMGYAGITSQDVAPHSIDIYHQATIAQIQTNLATKTCPVTTNITANNATPVVAALTNYTIPISTPFALTGSASDANAGDVLTYCWEQNDNASAAQTGASSVASITKASGPNWISFSPTTSPTRYMPRLATILAGLNVTPTLGGDAVANTEALSSVSRTLNFRLTVRDNSVYSSTAPIKVGQTNFADMVVTVTNTSGPFSVTAPNTAVTWVGGSSQTITWNVNNTTLAPVSCANVKISLSTDGGQTFPTVLSASTANDGTETLVIPNTPTTTARIKVEAVGNIFFDISNANFTISAGGTTLTTITTSSPTTLIYCAGAAVNVPFTANGTANAGNVYTAQLSNAAGSFASPVSIGTLSSTASSGSVSATIPSNTAAGTGYRVRVISSNPAVTGSDNGANITVNTAPAASTATAGGATTFCQGGSVILSGNTNGGTWSNAATTSSITVTTSGTYFITNTNNCGSVNSNNITVTVNPNPTASTITAGGATTFCQGGSVVLSGNNNGGTWSNGATTSSITVTTSGTYFVTNSNSCGSVNSNSITVTVNPNPTASTITAGGATTFCQGGSVVLSGNNNGGTWSNGATTSSITVTTSGTYFVTNTNNCGSVNSNSIVVTVNPNPTASNITAGGATTFCQGGSVVLSGNTNGGTWNTGATTTNLTVTTSGTYFVTNTNNCGSVNSNSIVVTVNPLPSASSISAGGATTFCQGGSVVLNGNTNGGTWNTGATTTNLTVTSSGTYFVTNTNNCGSVNSNSIVVTVNPLPTVSFSGLASTYPVTAAAVTLTGSPAGGTFSGTGVSGNTFNPSVAGVGGPYSITYTYTNGNGCTNSSTQQTSVTACTLLGTPGSITTVGGASKVCPGDVKSYSISAVSGATSYVWTAPAGASITVGQGTNAVTVSYSAGFTANDSLRVSAVNACGTGPQRKLLISRNVPSTPSAITGDLNGVCNKSNVPYSVTNVANVTYNWTWSVANTSISGQGSNAITSSFLSGFVSGKLSVTANNACGASSARAITVYARPQTPGAITGAASVCSGQQAVPYSIAPVANATYYVWYVPSGAKINDGVTTSTSTSLTTTSTNVTVNFSTTAGQVRVKAGNPCAAGSLSSLTVAFTCKGSDLNDQAPVITKSTDILVYPNPVASQAVMALPEQVSQASITVIDMYGKTVVSRVNFSGLRVELDARKLAQGNYIIRVQDRNHYYVGKFLKD